MNIKPWNVPLKAEWHRATTLLELSFSRNGLADACGRRRHGEGVAPPIP
jgi:hypothetical protein